MEKKKKSWHKQDFTEKHSPLKYIDDLFFYNKQIQSEELKHCFTTFQMLKKCYVLQREMIPQMESCAIIFSKQLDLQ